MPKQVTLVGWSELLFHAEELGFWWNYAHEILRVFQNYDRGPLEIYYNEICDYTPLSDPYIGERFKEDAKDHGDLNEMGRDIVRHFMEKHDLKVMHVAQDK